MKRLLQLAGIAGFVGMFNVVLLVVVIGVVSVEAGPTASGNGDCNGDGSINLADAVYLLTHIFESGPAPVALAQPCCNVSQTNWDALITIDSVNHPAVGFGGILLQPLEVIDVIEVPADRWLVIHEGRVTGPDALQSLNYVDMDTTGTVHDLASVFAVRRVFGEFGASDYPKHALAIPPGATIRMQNGSTFDIVSYHFRGVLLEAGTTFMGGPPPEDRVRAVSTTLPDVYQVPVDRGLVLDSTASDVLILQYELGGQTVKVRGGSDSAPQPVTYSGEQTPLYFPPGALVQIGSTGFAGHHLTGYLVEVP